MSMTWIKATADISKQWPIRNYSINLSMDIEWIPLWEWYLSKPEATKHIAMLPSFSEVMWTKCKEFCDKYKFVNIDNNSTLLWDSLYHTLMTMISEWINDIDQRWDSLFTFKINDNKLRQLKAKYREHTQETKTLEEKIANELEKQKKLKEAPKQIIETPKKEEVVVKKAPVKRKKWWMDIDDLI